MKQHPLSPSAALLLALLLFSHPASAANSDHLDTTYDLQETALEAAHRHVPMLIMFSADYCGYCRKLERKFMLRLQEDPVYGQKVLIRKVMVDSPMPVTDFNGEDVIGFDIASHYGVEIAPSLVFLSCDGEQVADKLIGAGTEKNYWEKLIARVDTALQQVRCKR